MPCGDGVFTGREIGQCKRTIFFRRYCIVRILQHREVAVHPGMDVALYGNEFRLRELFGEWRCSRRLRLVPLVIYFCQRMDVVRGLIVIDDFQFLIGLESEHVRDVAAALLVKCHRLRRRRFVRSACGNVHDRSLGISE